MARQVVGEEIAPVTCVRFIYFSNNFSVSLCGLKATNHTGRGSDLGEVLRVDGGEATVQRAVGCGQRLDVGREPRAGLPVSQGGQTQSKEALRVLSTHQDFPQHPPHHGSALLGTGRR